MKALKFWFWITLVCWLFISEAAYSASVKDVLYDKYEIELYGFVEIRQGYRTGEDPYEKDASISEGRIQLDMGRFFEWGIFKIKGDLVQDLVKDQFRAELREANLSLSPFDFLDMKIGRQVLTWGTGDLLFINDLFPKNWKSFFIGRDDEYLKEPSDAVKCSFFMEDVNLDVIFSPLFNDSVYVDGKRLSYWNPVLGRTAGRDYVLRDDERNRFYDDSELALRLYKNIGGVELALYGYYGYWSTPEGFNPSSMELFYPKLAVYGASVRTSLLGGIGNLEMGYYDSRDDREGEDPFVRNSEIRFLSGFERELMRDFTSGFQYYLEWMKDHDEYENGLGGAPGREEYRHLLTVRLTKLMMNQNLELSFFMYYSPSDEDAYLRPKMNYKITDQWSAEIGGNVFLKSDPHTFFGQFYKNTNVYGGIRWGF